MQWRCSTYGLLSSQVVKALDCRPRFWPHWQQGFFTSANDPKIEARGTFVSFRGDIKPSVPGDQWLNVPSFSKPSLATLVVNPETRTKWNKYIPGLHIINGYNLIRYTQTDDRFIRQPHRSDDKALVAVRFLQIRLWLGLACETTKDNDFLNVPARVVSTMLKCLTNLLRCLWGSYIIAAAGAQIRGRPRLIFDNQVLLKVTWNPDYVMHVQYTVASQTLFPSFHHRAPTLSPGILARREV